VARKNGKSTWGAGIGNYCFLADGEAGAECYTAATKREQATICHKEAELQIRGNPTLASIVQIFKLNLSIPSTGSKFVPLSSDSKTQDGLNPHFALIDEYHAHPTDELLEVLKTGMGARAQPLLLTITTAGFDVASPCHLEYEYACDVLEGIKQDDQYFGIVYTLDQGDDWADPAVWIKANPNLGVSVYPEFLRAQVDEAIKSPQKQNHVKVKNLNVWTQAETRWMTDESWMACADWYDHAELDGRECYGALDLSTSLDITALVLDFPPEAEGEPHKTIARFYMPGDNVQERERRDKVPYSAWIADGLITATPGNVIDYDFIEHDLAELRERYQILECAYDPWNSSAIVNHLTEAGLLMVPIRQQFSGMAAFTKQFERSVLGRGVAHRGHPILRWMMSCTEIKSDRQGNIMPMKPERNKSGKRIDGIVAWIMAHGRALLAEGDANRSAYETQELVVL
jgi:phage terminase large subunit-like protein